MGRILGPRFQSWSGGGGGWERKRERFTCLFLSQEVHRLRAIHDGEKNSPISQPAAQLAGAAVEGPDVSLSYEITLSVTSPPETKLLCLHTTF